MGLFLGFLLLVSLILLSVSLYNLFRKEPNLQPPHRYTAQGCSRVPKVLFDERYIKHRPGNIVPSYMIFGESFSVLFENPNLSGEYIFFSNAILEATQSPYMIIFNYKAKDRFLRVDLRSKSWVAIKVI